MLCQWRKIPQTAPSSCEFVTLPEEDRATAIGNMHKIGKDRAWFRIYPRGQTDIHTDILVTILRNRIHGRNDEVDRHTVDSVKFLASSTPATMSKQRSTLLGILATMSNELFFVKFHVFDKVETN